ncbi:glycosyltransferase family 2 protein [Myroides odoratimimus]|uniref:glycosyltransferase family 2 protein n=1 Tax=Myroides odoratimimus TaxID=76832 RepID=UPI00091F9F38|nr:glycosyltransferase family A protein [Myroides odoratimimus]SHM67135.1 Glycosyltransferase involved in cell wall bisynthesis [Myroides odoratimimus subsp. xuanwuensis]
MEENRILTIGFPVYNASKDIKLALESVLKQTYSNFILLIVNDGSTDDSMEIVRSFNDNRIIIIDDGLNKGLAKRLNEIIDLTTTKYLARMDADDLITLNKIERQMDILLSNQSIDVLGTNAFSLDKDGNIQGVRYEYENEDQVIDVDFFIHATIVGKTQWFKDNKYDERLYRMQDTELWFRTKEFSNFKMLTEPHYYYREESGGYYKKYFKSIKLFWYVAKKNNYSIYWLFRFLKVCLMSCFYFVLNVLGKENILLERRNKFLSEALLEKETLNLKELITKLS